MTRYLALSMIFALMACGGEKKAPADPAQEALTSFKDHMKAFPGTLFAEGNFEYKCILDKVDAVKSDSAASPFTGTLEGAALMTGTDPKMEIGGVAITSLVVFAMEFRNEGNGWVCDSGKSSAVESIIDSNPEKYTDSVCDILKARCTGKAP